MRVLIKIIAWSIVAAYFTKRAIKQWSQPTTQDYDLTNYNGSLNEYLSIFE